MTVIDRKALLSVGVAAMLILGELGMAQIIQNMVQLSNIDVTNGGVRRSGVADCWGFIRGGREYAIVAITKAGVVIVDVTDPRNPVETGFVPIPSDWTHLYHVKSYSQGYLYAFGRNSPGIIIDVRDPYNPRLVKQYSRSQWDGVYDVYIDENRDMLVLFDVRNGPPGKRTIFMDLTADPANPAEISSVNFKFHHIYIRGNYLYGFLGFDILDISDITHPTHIKSAMLDPTFTHSGWLNDDGTLMSTDHEYIGGHVKFWDISGGPLADPVQIGEFATATNHQGAAQPHKSRWYGDLVYMCYWLEGVRVIDVSDPTHPVQVGAFDMDDPNPPSGEFRGVWGCYPYFPSRNIVASDVKRGLFILDFVLDGPGIHHQPVDSIDVGAGQIEGSFSVINGPDIVAQSSFVVWRTDVNPSWQQAPVQPTGTPREYEFSLPLNQVNHRLDYYLEVQDSDGRVTRAPGQAPHDNFYRVRVTNITGITGTTLMALTARSRPEGVELSWQTEQERQNAGFVVRRKKEGEDGYRVVASYQEYPELRGQGNSTTGKAYAFIDRSVPGRGKYFYQLSSIDFDGNEIAYPAIEVMVDNRVIGSGPVESFQLLPNFPNPFNTRTVIRFTIPPGGQEPVPLSLEVYDIRGQKIATLFQDVAEAGSYVMYWDGQDDKGEPVSSGVYLYALRGEGISLVRKMVLLR